MAQRNVQQSSTVKGPSAEAEIIVQETEDGLTITIPGHLKVEGLPTEAGNLTLATTHGNVTLGSGLNLSINLWQRGGTAKPRRNVTLK
jgi:hypothetical protein